MITNLLRKRLKNSATRQEQGEQWLKWIKNWDQFAFDAFLRSTYENIRSVVNVQDEKDLDPLKSLLPWPEEAIHAYSVYNYTEQLDQSVVQLLRDDLGQWWSPNMHHIKGGMSKLPEAFINPYSDSCGRTSYLYPKITFNSTVRNVEYTYNPSNSTENKVTVTGTFTTSGQEFSMTGDAIIFTVPLHIIRQIKIKATEGTDSFPVERQQAIEDVWYGPSTKIMIQSKTRFWENNAINGGFSKTNLPIGQLHYPTNDPEDPIPGEKGILLCYTWKAEALLFGSLPPQIAIREAVREIAEIHPEITDNFEVGAVQAWYSDPATQGAYALLKPNQFENVVTIITDPCANLFFAGEGISTAAGWIQGALETGLRAAYQFYSRNETQ